MSVWAWELRQFYRTLIGPRSTTGDRKLDMSVMWSKETTAVKKVNFVLLATGD